ncbi:hypothetical protein IQ266_12330 [filamentous cyanobacterium LEGE 11480]|uniref:Uncharacterized protein n=1 Tax=Romeriopsis navalis LEGE 11480 TaxID=2777977 RepID=A0A928VMP4_9CYAN|nr:hypothetical protein [Romeriopsis navalis]MBE9030518.1 hypothetical protein [Romeriopsis navalis LEGE 11480]
MPHLQSREAEFQYLCERSRHCATIAAPTDSPIAHEVFDALDMLPLHELAEVVAIYLLGRNTEFLSYAAAHHHAINLGFDGVNVLYTSSHLYEGLARGWHRLQAEGPVTWSDS